MEESTDFEQKKVQEVKGSYYIYLPRDWAVHYNVADQKRVFMKRLDDDSLIIRANSNSNYTNTQFRIELEMENVPEEKEIYEKFLLNQYLTAYIVGYKTIIFHKKTNISLTTRSRIRKMTQHFHGMMIVNEKDTEIVVENTSQSVEIHQLMRQIISKVGLTISNYIEIVEKNDGNDLQELINQDDQIDEHRYAIERQVHRILRYPTLALDSHTNATECLHIAECSRIIERIADHMVILAGMYNDEPIHDKNFVLRELRGMYRLYCDIQDYFERDDSFKFYKIIEMARQYVEENHNFPTSKNPDKSYIGQIRRIYALISDVAEFRINDIMARDFKDNANKIEKE